MSDTVDPLRVLIAGIVREELAKVRNDEQPSAYLDTAQAAAFASVSTKTIRRWVREGRLVEYRAGNRVRIVRADLVELLKRGRRKVETMSPEALARRRFG